MGEGIHRLVRRIDAKLEAEFDAVQKMVPAEAALAWRYLWVGLRGYHYRTLRVTTTAVANQCNKHSSSGKRALEALKRFGLIDVIDSPDKGQTGKPWIVYVYHPSEVAEVRLATAGDGQPELPIMDDEEAPKLPVGTDAEEAWSQADARPHPPVPPGATTTRQLAVVEAQPLTGREHVGALPARQFAVVDSHPRSADIDTGSKSLKTLDTLDKDTLKGVHVRALQADRGCERTSANSEPMRIASILGGVLGGCDPAERVRRIDSLDRWILDSFEQELGACDISDEPRRKVAMAVVDGVYPVDQLQRVVHCTIKKARGGGVKSVGAYFFGAAKKSMREHDARER